MNWIGTVLVLTGMVFLIYSVLYRNKVNMYSRRYSKKSEMKLIKEAEFLRLQLYFSIFNSIFQIIFGVLIILFNLSSLLIFAGVLLFDFINFLLIIESKRKGYVDYKVGKTY
jgi:hypothetical protein